MPSYRDSPFYQLHEIAQRCLSGLGSGDLAPQELWMIADPQGLEGVQRALRKIVEDLETGLIGVGRRETGSFASVTDLEEWAAINKEIPGWKKAIGGLRPAADPAQVKDRLLSIRIRVSELVDHLIVRSAVRDPYNRVSSSHAAMKSVAPLLKERELRELALGLLQGGSWEEALEGSVADWSVRLGSQHRVFLNTLCSKILDQLRRIRALPQLSRALRQVVETTSKADASLRSIHQQLIKVPLNRVDAGTSSDFHYMAELAKKIVDAVTDHHGSVIADFAGQPLPAPVDELFQTLHLTVPRARDPRQSQLRAGDPSPNA